MCNIISFFLSSTKIKKPLTKSQIVQYHFFFFHVWVKRTTICPQVCNIIFFFFYVSWQNHLWAHKWFIFFLLCESIKPFASSQLCNIIFLFTYVLHIGIKTINYEIETKSWFNLKLGFKFPNFWVVFHIGIRIGGYGIGLTSKPSSRTMITTT